MQDYYDRLNTIDCLRGLADRARAPHTYLAYTSILEEIVKEDSIKDSLHGVRGCLKKKYPYLTPRQVKEVHAIYRSFMKQAGGQE